MPNLLPDTKTLVTPRLGETCVGCSLDVPIQVNCLIPAHWRYVLYRDVFLCPGCCLRERLTPPPAGASGGFVV